MRNNNEAWIDGLPIPAQIAVVVISTMVATCIALAAFWTVTQ